MHYILAHIIIPNMLMKHHTIYEYYKVNYAVAVFARLILQRINQVATILANKLQSDSF